MGLCSEWKELGRGYVISLGVFINRRREAKASAEEAALLMLGRTGRVQPLCGMGRVPDFVSAETWSWSGLVLIHNGHRGLCLVLVLSEIAYVHLGNKTLL